MRSTWLALGLVLLSSLAVAAEGIENKWRLQLSGDAESSGQITLAIAAANEEAITVSVPIADDLDENAVAAAEVNA